MAEIETTPVKDQESQHPIADAWRQTLREIVKAFVEGDFALTRGVASVSPVAPRDADRMLRYVADYGETLIELPNDTWTTSVAQWRVSHWDVLVDLWTKESGRSDMVLDARIYEVGSDGFRFEIHAVYVP